MQFVHPLFLLGLSAVAVPIIIHLVYKIKARQVEFPTIRFLRAIDKKVARRQRLQELLLLLLRCMALIMLALALAGPAWKPSGGASPGKSSGVAAVIVLDDSYSMSLVDGESSVFSRAKSLAGEILKTLTAGDSVCVLTSRGDPAMSRDPNSLARNLPALDPSLGGQALGPEVKAALKLLDKTEAVQRELYVISDFQQRASELKDIDFAVPHLTTVLIPVPPTHRENAAITALEQISPFATTATPFRVRVNAANRGAAPASVNLTVRIDGKSAAEQLVALGPKSSTTLAMDLNFDKPGWKLISAEIEKDALPADNKRLLAVRVRSKLGVLICRSPLDSGVSPSFYIEKALNPGGAASTGISLTNCEPAKLSKENLDDYAVVILAECTPTDDAAIQNLRTYVAMGGSLVIAGAGLDAGQFNAKLATETPGNPPLAPARIAGVLGVETDSGRAESIKDLDIYHPIFARLRHGDERLDLSSAAFFKAVKLEPFSGNGARTLARFSSGDPAILERPYGLGRVVMFASPLHTESTNLPLKVSFLPMMHSLIVYLTTPSEMQSVRVGESLRLHLAAEGAPASAKYRWNAVDTGAPTGGGITRDIPAVVSNGYATYDAGAINEIGCGEFEWTQSGRPDVRDIAVNVDPEEGVLDYADAEKLVPDARVIRTSEELNQLLTKIRLGQNLSPWLFLLGFLLVVAEALIANRFAARPAPKSDKQAVLS